MGRTWKAHIDIGPSWVGIDFFFLLLHHHQITLKVHYEDLLYFFSLKFSEIEMTIQSKNCNSIKL